MSNTLADVFRSGRWLAPWPSAGVEMMTAATPNEMMLTIP